MLTNFMKFKTLFNGERLNFATWNLIRASSVMAFPGRIYFPARNN